MFQIDEVIMRFKALSGIVFLALIMTSCAPGISKQVRSQVTFTQPFNELQQNPKRFEGEMALLGGRIIEARSLEVGTELVVLQLPLDGSDRPQETDKSQGRFLVRTDQFLDPAIYSPGTRITAAGRVEESVQRQIGQMPYRYPVIHLEEIKTWPQRADSSPRFHFGVGVGTRF
jgi:outer membrane lipoprotein